MKGEKMIQKELARLVIKFENWQLDEKENLTLEAISAGLQAMSAGLQAMSAAGLQAMSAGLEAMSAGLQAMSAAGLMVSVYTEQGDYIGSLDNMTLGLLAKKGILPEKSDPSHNVCSIGKSFKDGKWYGWSHRAIHGFSIGDEVKEGDCCNTPGVTDDYLKEHLEADISLPVGFIAKTEEDCKQMAIAFAESIS